MNENVRVRTQEINMLMRENDMTEWKCDGMRASGGLPLLDRIYPVEKRKYTAQRATSQREPNPSRTMNWGGQIGYPFRVMPQQVSQVEKVEVNGCATPRHCAVVRTSPHPGSLLGCGDQNVGGVGERVGERNEVPQSVG